MTWKKTDEDSCFNQWVATNDAYSPDESHKIKQYFENLRKLGLSENIDETMSAFISKLVKSRKMELITAEPYRKGQIIEEIKDTTDYVEMIENIRLTAIRLVAPLLPAKSSKFSKALANLSTVAVDERRFSNELFNLFMAVVSLSRNFTDPTYHIAEGEDLGTSVAKFKDLYYSFRSKIYNIPSVPDEDSTDENTNNPT